VTPRTPCAGPINRRDILRLGLLGTAAGLPFPTALRLQEASAALPGGLNSLKDTSIILVFCHGGPSHIDTYDMKPEAPAEYRGPFQPIRTNVPGIEITELFPRQAKIADKFSLIRSVAHNKFDHQDGAQMFLTGRPPTVIKPKPDHPDFLAVTAKLREATAGAMPPSVGVPPVEFSGPGYLGPAYAPFVVQGDPDNARFSVPDLLLDPAQRPRLDRRQRLRASVDALRRDLSESSVVAATDQVYQKAVDIVTREQSARAFDLDQEPEKLRER
jgi:hypothetical protein